MTRTLPDAARRARGIALPVILLFLLVITVAASFGIRRATLNEGITRNQLDYEIARQAAEAALRDAERDLRLNLATGSKPAGATCTRDESRPIRNRTGLPHFDSDCPKGQCRFPAKYYDTSNYTAGPPTNPHPWWPTTKGGLWNDGAVDPAADCNFKGAVPLGTFTGTPRIEGVAQQPEYLIEYMERGLDRVVRITARGFGADRNTETVLQTYYRPKLD
jgi:type IV pilus assembly protein PilX